MCPDGMIHVQGRRVDAADLTGVQALVDGNPDWSRHRLAKELCRRWGWRTPRGQLKTFAARSLLITLSQKYGLRLPPLREACRRIPWGVRPAQRLSARPLVEASLASLQPLSWQAGVVQSPAGERGLDYLREYHYLGCNRPVGTHLLYLVQDAQGRDLSVHLIGAAAWHCAARDRYIGWSSAARVAGLHRIGNHSRFLVLPWVRVPQLASHLLGALAGRICLDWPSQHGWRLELLESFVEIGRFAGACYRAAHWQEVGQTTGRTRQEKEHRASAPPKSVWVCGLEEGFRERLGSVGQKGGGR
jgi:hypothetical protein